MENNFANLSVVFFLILLMFLFSCGGNKDAWMGTIEEVDGVTVIHSPSEPMYGPEVCSLEEDLAIYSKGREEEFIFQYTPNLVVDEEENIYVLDTRAAHVFVFDRQGKLVRDFGKRGQGPGEMMSPLDFRAAPNGNLMILDIGQARLNFFSTEGDHLRSFQANQQDAMRRPVIDSQGHVIAGVWLLEEDEKTWKTILKKYSPDFDSQLVITTQAAAYEGTGQVQEYFEAIRGTNMNWDVTCDDNIIWGTLYNCEIFVHNSDGKLYKKIIRDYEGKTITEKDKKKLIRDVIGDAPIPASLKVKWPDRWPAIRRFTCDDEGRIFVQTYDKTTDGTADYYDVFDPEGRYMARIALKYRPQVWKKGKLYTMEEDEEGYQVVRRYKVSWNL